MRYNPKLTIYRRPVTTELKAPPRKGSPNANRDRAAAEAAEAEKRKETGAAYSRPISDGDQIWVGLDEIVPNPENDREDPGDLSDISGSIKEIGLLEPLLLLPRQKYIDRTEKGRAEREQKLIAAWLALHPELDPDAESSIEQAQKVPWVLLSGWRRFCAAREVVHEAEWDKVEGVIRGKMVVRMYQAMLWENLLRKELNPVEEARAYQRLMDEAKELGTPMGVNEFARTYHLSKTKVSKRLRLLKAPAEFQALAAKGLLTGEGAYKLQVAELEDRGAEVVALLEQNLSIEAAIERLTRPTPVAPPPAAPAPPQSTAPAVEEPEADSAPGPQDVGDLEEHALPEAQPQDARAQEPATAREPVIPAQATAAASTAPPSQTAKSAPDAAAATPPDTTVTVAPTIDAANRRRNACQNIIQANSAPSGTVTDMLAAAFMARMLLPEDEKSDAWTWAGHWLEADPASPATDRARTRHAFALALATIEGRLVNEGRVPDALRSSYIDLLRRRGGYEPTDTETELITPAADATVDGTR